MGIIERQLMSKTNPLEFEDQRHLTAAEGFVELEMFLQAQKEIDLIEPDIRHLSEVRAVEIQLLMGKKKWEQALKIANHLCKCEPMGGEHFISAAFCLHEMKRTREAKEKLLSGPKSLQKRWVFDYNMACYECRLGNIDSAKAYLVVAIKKNPAAHAEALDDRDLELLWKLLGKKQKTND